MSKEQHLVYFSSRYTHQDKVNGSFTINLPHILHLEGDWKCGVLDFFIESDTNLPSLIYILADFCEGSFINKNKQLPIVKKVGVIENHQQYSFFPPLYIYLKQKSLIEFDLLFLDNLLKPLIFSEKSLIECTLQLIKE